MLEFWHPETKVITEEMVYICEKSTNNLLYFDTFVAPKDQPLKIISYIETIDWQLSMID